MVFDVRKARLSDIQEIALIHVQSWKSAFKGLMPERYINSYTFEDRKTEWLSILNSGSESVIIVEENNKLVGFLSYSENVHFLYLSKLYLCPSIYGKGVGCILMKELESNAQLASIDLIRLYVLDSNQSAIKFYSKQGFEFGDGFESEEFEGETIIDLLMEKHL
ncbi:GNAT family N-acetyltransferase [Vibrio echinoideorum]|uniref:GNAT family N-acetyltransferase n=1 Tax=Vibrio echinoideorum TaxID=2100116 RepID=UPI0035504F2A